MGGPAPREENLEPPAAGVGQIPSPEFSSLRGKRLCCLAGPKAPVHGEV